MHVSIKTMNELLRHFDSATPVRLFTISGRDLSLVFTGLVSDLESKVDVLKYHVVDFKVSCTGTDCLFVTVMEV